VGMALPQPDGTKVTEETRLKVKAKQKYFLVNKDAKEALGYAIAKRFPKAGEKKVDPETAAKVDEFIKKHLVQIKVEGIDGLYFDELDDYFKTLKDGKLKLFGMDPDEEAKVNSTDPSLPKKGWIFEIRGYTYHWDGEEFIKNTLLENLRRPDKVGNKLSKPMQEKIKDRLGYFWLARAKDNIPEGENFKFIKKSFVMELMGGSDNKQGGGFPGKGNMQEMKERGGGPVALGGDKDGKPAKAADKRADWRPIGQVAGSLFAGGAGGGGPGFMRMNVGNLQAGAAKEAGAIDLAGRQPRLEFALLFVWRDPAVEDNTADVGGTKQQ
jgi:hypothetical protein